MSEQVKVENVSDTALWVACYRAQETLRPDALFKDPLADKLAGERGRELAKLLGNSGIMYWIMVMRTLSIDRLILNSLDLGVDCVLNLGAGLDTRPYRMKLPSSLKWIEIDFPHMIEFKNSKLAAEKPVCHLERISADLSNEILREKIFKKIGAENKKVLIITEGVIPYLSNESAASLAKAIFAIPNFRYWIQDYRLGQFGNSAPRSFRKNLKSAPFIFKTKNWLEFFKNLGWGTQEIISAVEESQRVSRPFPMPFPWNFIYLLMPGPIRKKNLEKLRREIGYVLLKKLD